MYNYSYHKYKYNINIIQSVNSLSEATLAIKKLSVILIIIHERDIRVTTIITAKNWNYN